VRHADLCVPPSAYAADLVRRAFGVDPARLRVCHNGAPEEFLRYAHDPVASQDGPLVFFGRFEPTKGVDVLVEALGVLGARAPQTLIIGRGPEEQALRASIDTLGLADRVGLLPWMTHDELGQVLTDARLVVLPSRQENFSLAVLSAMAVGAPIISTRVGGTPEIIVHEETGLLVPPDQPERLAQAILRLLDDRDLARRLGQAGRRHVHQHLTWDAVAQEFEQLFHTLPALGSVR
jgi:phosphatidylinositol alpha-1,6-mannosyltransferase